MYARMLIGEGISEEHVAEFKAIYHERIEPQFTKEVGFRNTQLLIEEGGRMILVLTIWNSREDCLRYHASRTYRQSVAETQHLMAGDFVVKLFKCVSQQAERASQTIREKEATL